MKGVKHTMSTYLVTMIAKAIRSADKSWFNEDYTKQALAVLEVLRAQGWELCPKEPPEGLIEFAVDNMPFGRMRPEDLLREIYRTLIINARKF